MERENGRATERDNKQIEKDSRRALLYCSEEEAELSHVVRVYDYGEMFSGWTLTIPNPKFLSIPEKKRKVKEKQNIENVESKIKMLISGQGDTDTSNGAINSELASGASGVFLNYRSPNTLSYDLPTWRIIVDPGSFRYIERVHPRKQKTAAKTQAKLLPNGEILNFQMVDSGGGYKEICFFDAACAFDKHLCKVTDIKVESRLSVPLSGLPSDVPKLQLTHWRSEDSKIKVKLVAPRVPGPVRSTTAATSSSCACSSNSQTDSSKSSRSDKAKAPCAFCGFTAKEIPKKVGISVTPSSSVYTDISHGHGIRIKSRDSQTMKSLERLKPLLQSISSKCSRIKSSEKDERLSKKTSYDDLKVTTSETKVPRRSKSESKMDWLKLSNPISPVHGLSMNTFQIPRPVKKGRHGGIKVKTLKFNPPRELQSGVEQDSCKGSKKLTLQETAKLGKDRDTSTVDVVAKLAKELDKKCKNDLALTGDFLPTVSGQGVRLELPIPQSVYKN